MTNAGTITNNRAIFIDSTTTGAVTNNHIIHCANDIQSYLQGNLGIGIATPLAKLHVTNTTSANSLLIEDETNPDSTPFVVDNNGNVGIGTNTPTTSALLSLNSTTKGFLQPKMTTTERGLIGTPVSGLSVYDTTQNTSSFFDGTAWVNVGKNYHFNSFYDYSTENTTSITVNSGSSYFKIPTGSVISQGSTSIWNVNSSYPNDLCIRYVGPSSDKDAQFNLVVGFRVDHNCIGDFSIFKDPTITVNKFTAVGEEFLEAKSKITLTAHDSYNISFLFYDNDLTQNSSYFLGFRHNHANNVVFTVTNFTWRVYSHYD
jgi:hypothetical protein